jgi:hypothetical protein
MSAVTWCVFALYLIAFIGVLVRKLRMHGVMDLLPSLGWMTLMVLPFMGERSNFAESGLPPQTFGVFFMAAVLLAGDHFAACRRRIVMPFSGTSMTALMVVCAVVLAGLQGLHLFLMPQIPLLEWLHRSPQSLTVMRENSSKLLAIPPVLTYAFHASLVFLAPLTLTLALIRRKYAVAAAVFAIALFYSQATLAKGPGSIFMAVSGIMCFAVLRPDRQRGLCKWLGLAALPVVLCGAFFLIFNPASVLNFRTADPSSSARRLAMPDVPDQPFTLADHARFSSNDTLNPAQAILNKMFYRTFLGPIDVSHRWYLYYPGINHGFMGLYGLTSETRNSPTYRHPANRVGQWAYLHRFPEQYWPTLSAYASVDADAYSRFGCLGIAGAGLLLLAFRLLSGIYRLSGQLGDALHAAIALILGIMLPMASLPAALIIQGPSMFLLIPIACVAVLWIRRKPIFENAGV